MSHLLCLGMYLNDYPPGRMCFPRLSYCQKKGTYQRIPDLGYHISANLLLKSSITYIQYNNTIFLAWMGMTMILFNANVDDDVTAPRRSSVFVEKEQ